MNLLNIKPTARAVTLSVALLTTPACVSMINNLNYDSLSSVTQQSPDIVAKAVNIADSEYDTHVTYTAKGVVLPTKDALSLGNSEYFELVAKKDKKTKSVDYSLHVNVTYLDYDAKYYDTLSDKQAKKFKVETTIPGVVKCDINGYCTYTESVLAILPKSYLESHKANGMDLRFSGATKDDVFINVPASYIGGFFMAVNS